MPNENERRAKLFCTYSTFYFRGRGGKRLQGKEIRNTQEKNEEVRSAKIEEGNISKLK